MTKTGQFPQLKDFGKLSQSGTSSSVSSGLTVKDMQAMTSTALQGALNGSSSNTDSQKLLVFNNLSKASSNNNSGNIFAGKPSCGPIGKPNIASCGKQLSGKEKLASRGAFFYANGRQNPIKNAGMLEVHRASIFNQMQSITPTVSYGYGNTGVSINVCSGNNELSGIQKFALVANAFGGVDKLAQFAGNAISSLFNAIGGSGASGTQSSKLSDLTSLSQSAFEAVKSNDPQVRQKALQTLESINQQYGTMAEDIYQKGLAAEKEVTSKESAYSDAQAKTKSINDNLGKLEEQLANAPEDKKDEIKSQISDMKKQLEQAQSDEQRAKEALAEAKKAVEALDAQAAQLTTQYNTFLQQYKNVISSLTKPSSINAEA